MLVDFLIVQDDESFLLLLFLTVTDVCTPSAYDVPPNVKLQLKSMLMMRRLKLLDRFLVAGVRMVKLLWRSLLVALRNVTFDDKSLAVDFLIVKLLERSWRLVLLRVTLVLTSVYVDLRKVHDDDRSRLDGWRTVKLEDMSWPTASLTSNEALKFLLAER